MVPREGLEPSRLYRRRILSPLRLPIPPSRLCNKLYAVSRESATLLGEIGALAGREEGEHTGYTRIPTVSLFNRGKPISEYTFRVKTLDFWENPFIFGQKPYVFRLILPIKLVGPAGFEPATNGL